MIQPEKKMYQHNTEPLLLLHILIHIVYNFLLINNFFIDVGMLESLQLVFIVPPNKQLGGKVVKVKWREGAIKYYTK